MARAAEATAQRRARPGAPTRAGSAGAGASEPAVIRKALAPRSSVWAAEPVAADVRRRLPIPGRVWEAERRAQREPGAARRGGVRTPAATAAAAPWRGARGFYKGDAACRLPPGRGRTPPPRWRGSPGIPERAGAASRGVDGAPGQPRRGGAEGGDSRPQRGRSRLQPLPSEGRSVGAAAAGWGSGSEIPDECWVGPYFPSRPVIQLSV